LLVLYKHNICMVKMPALYADLSLGAQTSYAELFDMAQVVEATKFASLQGSFHRRQIRGKAYVYFNFRDIGGQGRSAYVGPESDRVAHLVDEVENSRVPARDVALAQRAQACIALGCVGLPERDFKIIQKLAGYGFFSAGGVLLGPYAHAALGNMLGVRWGNDTGSPGSGVIDGERKVAIGVPTDLRIPARDAITSLEQGLLPMQEFAGYNGGRRRAPSDRELPIDVLIADFAPSDAVESPMHSMSVQPVKFLEVLLEDTARAVVFGRSGACVVNLPDPAHLALYKLMASTLSPPAEQAKLFSNLEQAAALIEWHIDNRREDRIQQAGQHLRGCDPDWGVRVDEALASLARRHPPLASALGQALS